MTAVRRDALPIAACVTRSPAHGGSARRGRALRSVARRTACGKLPAPALGIRANVFALVKQFVLSTNHPVVEAHFPHLERHVILHPAPEHLYIRLEAAHYPKQPPTNDSKPASTFL